MKTIFSGKKSNGFHSLNWDGRDDYGYSVGSGIYLILIQSEKQYEAQKVMLLK